MLDGGHERTTSCSGSSPAHFIAEWWSIEVLHGEFSAFRWQEQHDSALPAVRAALEGVPDPVNGLLVYRGRGGEAGAREPRQPRPAPSTSAVALPEPQAEPQLDLTGISALDPARAVTAGGPGL